MSGLRYIRKGTENIYQPISTGYTSGEIHDQVRAEEKSHIKLQAVGAVRQSYNKQVRAVKNYSISAHINLMNTIIQAIWVVCQENGKKSLVKIPYSSYFLFVPTLYRF